MYRCVDELVLLTLLNLKDMSDKDIDSIVQAGQTELQNRDITFNPLKVVLGIKDVFGPES